MLQCCVPVKKPVAYLDENGITIKSQIAGLTVGDTVEIGGLTYS